MNEIIIAIGLPIIRSIGGWASFALKDGVISKFEMNKLMETVIRTGIIGTLIYFGAEGYGLEVDVLASSATAIILDMLMSTKKQSEK
jgi:hypothetical protein